MTGRKLLLADDSVTIQKVVDLTFSDEGMEVVTVGDGQQALEKLEELAPDIVLADVFMPGLNGYQLCEHIRRTERFRHIPVMLLVGSFEPYDEEEARRVGADDHLTKPFQSIRTLIAKVGNLLTGGRGGSDSAEAPTRQLAPPPEAVKENRPDTDFLERSTADTAPLPETGESTEQSAAGLQREVPFSDLSMDDEMIEATSPAGETGGAEQAVYARPTEQYSEDDLREAGILPQSQDRQDKGSWEETNRDESAPEAELAVEEERTPEAFASAATGEASTQWGQTRAASSSQRPPASDDALLDLDDPAQPPPPAMAEADDFILDLLDDEQAPAPKPAAIESPAWAAPPAPAAEAYPAIFEEGSTRPAEESYSPARAEETYDAPGAQEFVEPEAAGEEGSASEFGPAVAELPTETSGQTPSYEFSTAPTVRLPEDYRPEDYQYGEAAAAHHREESEGQQAAEQNTVQKVAPEERAQPQQAQAGQITLDQLSPEAIDAIARRAVELMSEMVVERVAWEVVPQLAELMIKRRLDEERNSKQ